MALDNISPQQIAFYLNKNGIKTRKGNNWSNIVIHRMLNSEVYLGKIVTNKAKGRGEIMKF